MGITALAGLAGGIERAYRVVASAAAFAMVSTLAGLASLPSGAVVAVARWADPNLAGHAASVVRGRTPPRTPPCSPSSDTRSR
jgi:hypothetical protein